jgi:hypothetical protein
MNLDEEQATYLCDAGRSFAGPRKMKETLATLGFILFFAGSMIDISGSLFVTEGGTPAATYFKVGIMELVGTLIFLIGIYLIVKTR